MPALLRKDEKLGEGVDVERWAVVRKIGDGGFAEVYEVRDTLAQDQRVRPKRRCWVMYAITLQSLFPSP